MASGTEVSKEALCEMFGLDPSDVLYVSLVFRSDETDGGLRETAAVLSDSYHYVVPYERNAIRTLS